MTFFLLALVGIVVVIALIGVVVPQARKGMRQEDLNTHDGDRLDEPKADRPAGPGAEAMGVDGPGDPGLRGDRD